MRLPSREYGVAGHRRQGAGFVIGPQSDFAAGELGAAEGLGRPPWGLLHRLVEGIR